MAKKTNWTDANGRERYKLRTKVGVKKNKYGIWVDDYKYFYGDCKSEAERKRDEYLALDNRNADLATEYTGVLIDKYIEEVFKPSAELAENTKKKYLCGYRLTFEHSKAAGKPINKLTPFDIQEVYNTSNASTSAIRNCHKLLVKFFKFADVAGICANLTVSIKQPRKQKRANENGIEVWSDNDLRRVIMALEGSTLRFLVVLAVNSGARISELLALTYDDIRDGILYINKQLSDGTDIDGKTSPLHIAETKTINSNRAIPLSDAVIEEFEKHRLLHNEEMMANGYRTNNIFTTSGGEYLYRRNVIRSLDRLYRRIDVAPRKFHAYRHTFGTNLSRAGIPIEHTAALMGHSSVTVTAKYYVDVNAAQKKDAVEKIAAFSLDTEPDPPLDEKWSYL